MANLSNINNKFLFTDGDFLKIGNLAPINNISGTESGLSITNSNVASIALDNTAANGKTYVMYSDDGGKLNFYDVDASSGRLVIDSSGNVGIGTGLPAHGKLVISSNQNNSNNFTWLLFDNQGAGYGDWNVYKSGNNNLAFGYGTSNGASYSNALTLQYGGNVGIGTLSPSSKLEIAAANSQIRLTDTDDSKFVLYSYSGGKLIVRNNSTNTTVNQYTLTEDGKFGIGTISPSKQLQVQGSAPWIRIQEDSASSKRLDLYVDPSTAIAYIAANQSAQQLSFQTGSLDRIRILNNGNVGIGETSPNGKLDIKQGMKAGTTAAFTDPHLRLSASDTVDNTGFVGMTFATSSANNYGFSWGALRTTSALGGMHLRYHGNSAAGTDIFNIDYVGNVTIASQKYIRSSSSSGWLTIQGGATYPGGRIDMYGGSNGAAGIEFLTGGQTATPTLRFRIDDTGDAYFTEKVGIGTTTPGAKLEINAQGGGVGGYTGFKMKYGTSSVQSLYMGQVTAGNGAFIGTAQYRNAGYWQSEGTASSVINMDAAGNMAFYTNSGLTANTDFNITQRMSITNGGEIHIQNGTTTGGKILLSGADNDLKIDGSRGQIQFSINGVNKMILDTNQLYPDVDNTLKLGLPNQRWSIVYAVSGVNTSDETLKENIKECDLGIDFIDSLKPKSYNLKDLKEDDDAYGKKRYGLIAQDLLETKLKDSVFGKKDGEYGLSYNDLIAPMIKGMQELKADNDILKSRIETLENK